MHRDLYLVEPSPETIRKAMEKGRRERNEAIWAMLAKLFRRGSGAKGGAEAHGKPAVPPASAAMQY